MTNIGPSSFRDLKRQAADGSYKQAQADPERAPRQPIEVIAGHWGKDGRFVPDHKEQPKKQQTAPTTPTAPLGTSSLLSGSDKMVWHHKLLETIQFRDLAETRLASLAIRVATIAHVLFAHLNRQVFD